MLVPDVVEKIAFAASDEVAFELSSTARVLIERLAVLQLLASVRAKLRKVGEELVSVDDANREACRLEVRQKRRCMGRQVLKARGGRIESGVRRLSRRRYDRHATDDARTVPVQGGCRRSSRRARRAAQAEDGKHGEPAGER
jgi:hypothetical protein